MDKQVDDPSRLEQKLDNLRTKVRTESPTGGSKGSRLDELESRNFTLEEEVKDLKIQLNDKQNEFSKAQELVNKRTADLEKTKMEYEEKLKKMRGIFNAANKTINELRQNVASKNTEIEELKAKIESLEEKDQKTKSTADESRKSVEKLTTEMHSQAAMYNAQIEQLESKLRQATQHTTQVKAEFQQYKIRAHALLEQKKNTNADNSRPDTSELIATNKKLETDLSFKTTELKYAHNTIKAVENDLKRALELNAHLEKELEKAQKTARENTDSIKEIQEKLQELSKENVTLQEALREAKANYTASVKDFDDKLSKSTDVIKKNLQQKLEENEQLQSISEQLGEELTKLREELSQRIEQVDDLKKQLAAVKAPLTLRTNIRKDDSRPSSPSPSLKTLSRPSSTHNSLSDLLSDTEGRISMVSTSSLESSDKEKDYIMKLKHMAEMLNESEYQVQKLTEQEKFLKEEIRKLDRTEKRQNLNVEYLKNVVLKFFESNHVDREPLVPVISTILQLSPEETMSLKENAIQSPSSPVVLGFGVL
ncbi:grip and coiled-coil domain-containing protein 2 [Gigaspora margarita]|uniref:Grip and coiled-coil domain-containing protein 2 n=1 Tax=Gigaspora margarita TaxID=4874 RepID=A0A8H4B001_GIGMA|nr:grip and coiled-coil domain-containing protein 2 [Gigaspora margarita]